MARFDPSHASLDYTRFKASAVVLTGGASGIGAATVRLLHEHGAIVVFGDVDSTKAESLISSLPSASIDFVRTDVTSYSDNLNLFELALSKYGHVDHAIANAGLIEQPG
jgi:NAD(P)-dependent dehydrogenase (short-subunit alcohol dehydrogenase family)